ncbi:MAG: DUF3180 family protein [Marmoricola sp.]
MTREVGLPTPPPEDSPDQPPDPTPGPGGVRPTGAGPLVVLGAAAMVAGWSIRPLSMHFVTAEPVISAWSVVVIWVLATAVGIVALRTWRVLQRDPVRAGAARLEAYQAVNRLVLGKAAALAGAVVLGGYAGFAMAHLGIPHTELSGQRLLRGGLAAAGGLGMLVAGLLLERACRVRSDDT